MPLQSFAYWAADAASRLLEPEEREVVRGDLAETGESGQRTLQGVLGLVIRRQLSRLNHWRPWLTLASLTIPLAALLSLLARRASDGSAVYLWMWIDNSDWTIVHSTAFWHGVLAFAPGILFIYIALACIAWASALIVGWSAPQTRWLGGLALATVVPAVGALGLPHSLGHILALRRGRDYFGNAAVFVTAFYRRVLPVIVGITLVILPAWLGILRGTRIAEFGRGSRNLVLASSIVALGALVSQDLIWWQFRLPSLLPLALAAPAVHALLTRTGVAPNNAHLQSKSQ